MNKLYFINHKSLFLLLLMLLRVFANAFADQDWGRVAIEKDDDGHVVVTLENNSLYLEYGYKTVENSGEGLMRKLYLKSYPHENIPHMFEGAAHRGVIQRAHLIKDEPEYKTVRIEWAPQSGVKEKFNRPAVTDISIFPNSTCIRLEYQSFCYPHICDIGHPGGLDFSSASDTTAQGLYYIYGADAWQHMREQMNAPALRHHENPHHRLTNDLFPCYPNPLIDAGWTTAANNPLSYKGWYIIGVYHPENGRGFGRVIPVDVVPVIKLLWGKGFEYFPYWNQGDNTAPFTSYVFAVTGGADEILSTGKMLVDQTAAKKKQSDYFTVTNEYKAYNSPLIGNGEIVTTLGPTGYHNGFCPEIEHVNRTIFWAGRRLKDARGADIRIPRVPPEELIGPTIPLVRFGRLLRSLKIDGKPTTDDIWTQTLNPENGTVISELAHGDIVERTESRVCLTNNVLVFRTQFINKGFSEHRLSFVLNYEFGDANGERAEGTRLHIRRPHPDDLGFGNVEGTRSLETDLDKRPPHVEESLSVQYEIEKHLGEVHIGRYPNGVIRDTETGGNFIHEIELIAGEAAELWFWVMLSDRMTYAHFPTFNQVHQLLDDHDRSWKEFWNTSSVTIGDPQLEALRTSCLYTLRCNTSPWTIPPGYLSTHWEGRTFHDEFYPFMGMATSNYLSLAEHVPNYRLQTLPHALQRGNGRGAYFGWEVIETGEESAPYGHWVDEQFRHGQISECAWRYYLHTGDVNELKRFYPLLKGCAQWMAYDVVTRDAQGRLTTRVISDVSEHVKSGRKSIFVTCAAIRALENAAQAGEILNIDESDQQRWRQLARELRENLPVDAEKDIYRYADDVDIPTESAHLGMVYPFALDLHSPRVKKTLESAWEEYHVSETDANNEQVFSYNWIWAAGRLATICFYLGEADKGYHILQQTPKSIRAFMAPNEHYNESYGAFLPWLTSGAGAYVHAMNAMFVQVVDKDGAILLPAVPDSIPWASFKKLAADAGVVVSGEIKDGAPIHLTAHAAAERSWCFRIPAHMADKLTFTNGWRTAPPDSHGLVSVSGTLKVGDNSLID